MASIKSLFLPFTICCVFVLLWQTWIISRETSRYMAVVSCFVSQDRVDGYRTGPAGILQRQKQSHEEELSSGLGKINNGINAVLPKTLKYTTLNTFQGETNWTKLFLIILVTSRFTHVDRRLLVRSTWGKDSAFKSRWKTIFLLGKSNNKTDGAIMERIKRENDVHGDLLNLDFVEDFYNLSYKVRKGFDWALNNIMFSFLLKVDDDVFVNVPQLLVFLQSPSTPKIRLYAGNCYKKARVRRKGKYAISKSDYSSRYYPSYCSGGGFVMSLDVVRNIMEHYSQQDTLAIDDVYIGLLAKKIGVNITHYKKGFRMTEKRCKFRRYTLVQHPATGDCLKSLYTKSINSLLKRKLKPQTDQI